MQDETHHREFTLLSPFTEELFNISRKTADKHLERYAEGGLNALAARSHRPLRFPQRTDENIEALVLAERRLHRTWGPKKLQAVLERKHGVERPPAGSTIGEILRRLGLSVPRRRTGRQCALARTGGCRSHAAVRDFLVHLPRWILADFPAAGRAGQPPHNHARSPLAPASSCQESSYDPFFLPRHLWGAMR